ncbi:DUF6088 family protein [soil metagenome]
MKVTYKDSLNYKLRERINTLPSTVVFFADLVDLSGKTQVSRGIKALIEEKELVKIGYGIYAKSRGSEYTDLPVIKGGFKQAALAALDRLGIIWESGQPEQDYNSGRSTQVPVRPTIKLKSRLRRQIGYGNMSLRYE